MNRERLNREQLRALVREHGRPPDYVHAIIEKVVNDATVQTEVEIATAIAREFTTEQMHRAAKVHGGTIAASMVVFVKTIQEAREDGLANFLRDVGLIE